jgi:hypothetical protein
MSAFSNYMEDSIINHYLRNQAYTPAATVYVALFTTSGSLANLEAGTLTGEVSTSGTSYARQSVAFSVASGGATSNSADITFSTASGNWGEIQFMALMDSGTAGAGNVLMAAQLSANKTVNTGDVFKFLAGEIDVTVA